MRVAILGGGAGGAAAVAELTAAGHAVAFWSRSADTLAPFRAAGGVHYDGVLGDGLAVPEAMTDDLGAAIAGADGAVVTLPTFSHGPIGRALAEAGWGADRPVVLNPGHTGGALAFATAFAGAGGGAVPPVVEFSTLTYVARKYRPDGVTVTGRAGTVRAACLPGGEAALALAAELFPGADPVADVLASGLANVNMVLHPPGAVLAAAWVEATGGDFTFYVDAMTPGVGRVMAGLDAERRAVAAAFGHDLPPLVAEMRAIGTAPPDAGDGDLVAAVAAGEANRRIKAPDGFGHRYYVEDFGHGLLPFLEFARIAGVDAPVAGALLTLAAAAVGTGWRDGGRTAQAMGVAGLDRDSLLQRVRQA